MEESIACDLCGSFNHKFFLSTSGYNVSYNLVKCKECGLIFMNPRPVMSKIKSYYKEEYFNQQIGSTTPTKEYLDNNKKLDEQRLNFILGHEISLKNTTFLDIGCGCGTFLNTLKSQSLSSSLGIEPNKYFSEYARIHYSLNVTSQNLDEFYIDKTFDYISLWQVLDMIPNPSFLIDKTKKLLKKGGTLFIEIPNYLEAPKLPWKQRVYPSDPGQFFYFTKDTIKKMLEKHNLKIVNLKTIQRGSWLILSAKND